MPNAVADQNFFLADKEHGFICVFFPKQFVDVLIRKATFRCEVEVSGCWDFAGQVDRDDPFVQAVRQVNTGRCQVEASRARTQLWRLFVVPGNPLRSTGHIVINGISEDGIRAVVMILEWSLARQ